MAAEHSQPPTPPPHGKQKMQLLNHLQYTIIADKHCSAYKSKITMGLKHQTNT